MTRSTSIKDAALYEKMGRTYSETDARINTEQITRDQQYYLGHGSQKQLVDPKTIVDVTFGDYARTLLGPYR